MLHGVAALVLTFTIVPALTNRSAAEGPTERGSDEVVDSEPTVLAHYMPWYVADRDARTWGWHWTMNAFDPNEVRDGKRNIASHFYPLIGPYDSGNKDVLEYHLLLMKLSGIDGVIVDWYGLQDFRDYATLHRNTEALLDQADRFGMKVAVCYEDQTITPLLEAGKVAANRRVRHVADEIRWLEKNWFGRPCYVRLDDRPVLLSFGQSGLSNEEWSEVLSQVEPLAYFSEHLRRDAAVGAFDWPIPQQGLAAVHLFCKRSADWKHVIPVVFPRFIDVYAKAKVSDSYGRIEDDEGKTFRESLTAAWSVSTGIIQIATWNDWGEGTAVEPSREFAYRDLEVLQASRRARGGSRATAQPADLRLPRELLRQRRSAAPDDDTLDRIAQLIATGKWGQARAMLANDPNPANTGSTKKKTSD